MFEETAIMSEENGSDPDFSSIFVERARERRVYLGRWQSDLQMTGCSYMRVSKVRCTHIDPQIVGILFSGHPQKKGPPIYRNSQMASAG